MADEGHESTEALIGEVSERVRREYVAAYEEAEEKLADYLRRFEAKDRIHAEAVRRGEETEADYREWRRGQILVGKRWQELVDTLAEDYRNADRIAASIVSEYMPDAYAINHDYATFQVESGSNLDTSYTLYDRATVERLIRDQPDLLPAVKVDDKKDKAWNRKHIASAVTQGVLQGEDLGQVSKRIRSVADMDERAAIRTARTAMTSAQNAGRLDAYRRAAAMGIDVRKQWLATLDQRTRHSHRRLDDEVAGLDEAFSNGLMYPGDPSGAGGEVYNCRCTLVPAIDGVDQSSAPRNSKLGGMSYEEWRSYGARRPSPDTDADVPPMIRGLDKYTSEYLRKHDAEIGLDADKREELRSMIGRTYDQSDVYSYVSSDAIKDLARGGHLMNAFELEEARRGGTAGEGGVKMGEQYESARRKITEYLFGKDSSGMPSRQFEKYGFLGSSDSERVLSRSGTAAGYGNVCVKLKKSSMANRVTYTFGDSLNEMGNDVTMMAGGLGDNLSIAGIPVPEMEKCYKRMKALEKKTGGLDASDVTDKCVGKKWYIEAQMHGDVTMDDIGEVMIQYRWTGKEYVPNDPRMTEQEVQSLVEALSDRGVKVSRYSVRPDMDEETGKMINKVVWIDDTSSIEG